MGGWKSQRMRNDANQNEQIAWKKGKRKGRERSAEKKARRGEQKVHY
jgi:hypothetical protein